MCFSKIPCSISSQVYTTNLNLAQNNKTKKIEDDIMSWPVMSNDEKLVNQEGFRSTILNIKLIQTWPRNWIHFWQLSRLFCKHLSSFKFYREHKHIFIINLIVILRVSSQKKIKYTRIFIQMNDHELLINSHAVGMAVAQPLGFKIDFAIFDDYP